MPPRSALSPALGRRSVLSFGQSFVLKVLVFGGPKFSSGQPTRKAGSSLSAAAAAKSLQSCPTVRPHRRQPTRLPRPWDSAGKNAGVGCHFLLQCMKVKSESEVVQSRPTLSDPMDCSLPGSSIHGIFQARVLEWGAVAFSTTL